MSKTKELRGGSDYAWMEKALAVSEEEVLSMIRAERAKEAANPEPIETVDEKRLVAALMCMEAHFLKAPPMGPLTRKRYHNAFMASIPRLQDPKVRDPLCRSVALWIWIRRVLEAALPSLAERCGIGLAGFHQDDPVDPPDRAGLILTDRDGIGEDISVVFVLLCFTRDLIGRRDQRTAQELCLATQTDQMLYQVVAFCVNFTGLVYEGERQDPNDREVLGSVAVKIKQLLMASIKVLQAFISDNDLNMTVFFQTFFMDEYPTGRSAQPVYFDALGARADIAKQEVHYWLIRNSKLSDEATALLRRYFCLHNNSPPGAISSSHILAWNWLPEAVGERFKVALDGPLQSGEDVREVDGLEEIDRGWDENEKSDFERCRKYGRLSRQLDVWWAAARGPFYESSQPADIPTVAAAKATLMSLKESLMSRTGRAGLEGKESDTPNDTPSDPAQLKPAPFTYIESWPYRTDLNDSSAFADGPIVGLLAEIPNIIDPDHIPVFHAIILQSVVDQPGVSVSAVGENLSKARCRLLLATEAGRSLFRELLVYIGLWHKYEESTIFRVTREVVEAIHRNGLIPYAWVSLKSKDVISPAQAILLRIIGRIFQLRHAEPDSLTEKQRLEDMRLLSFFFREFRLRIVPECAALMNLQGCMRQGMYDHSEFPLDNWCMARINDGLIQYIQFLTVMADIYDIRQSLIQWEIAYDVIVLIKFAESAVLRKPFIPPAAADGSTASGSGQPHLSAAGAPSSPPPPPPPPHQGSVASSSTTTATTAAAYKGPTVQRKHAVERPYSPDAGSSGDGDADGDGDGDGSDDNEDGDGSDDALEEFDHPPHEYPWTGLKREVLALVATLLQPEPGQTRPGNPTVQRQFIENEGIVALLSYTIYDEHDPKGCGKRAIRWLLDGSVDINKFIRAIAARHQHEMHAQQEKSHNEQPEKQPQQEQQLPEREEDDHDDEEGREQPEGDYKPPPAGPRTSEKGKGEAKLPHPAPASSAAGAGSSSANAADDAATTSVTSKSVKAKKAAGNRRRRG